MTSDAVNHDQLFKELLYSFLPEFLLLVAPRNAHQLKLEHGHFLDSETFTDFPRGSHRRLDVVYQTETLSGAPETVLVHVEVEARYRRDFDRRMAHYGLSLHLRTGNPVLPIALLLKGGSGDGALVGEEGIGWKTVEMAVPGSWINRFRYLAFSLSAASAEEYLQRRDPLAAALSALMPYRQGTPAEHKLPCLRSIAQARELNPARTFQLANIVETYIHLDPAEQDKFRTRITSRREKEVRTMELTWADKMYAKWRDQGLEDGRREGLDQGMKQGITAGRREGRKEGRKEGEQLGRREAAQRILLRQLAIRFGELPRKVVQAVEKCADLDQLERWSDQILTAPDLASMGLG